MKNNKLNTLIEINRNRKLKYFFLSMKFTMTFLMGIEIIVGSSLPLLLHNKKILNHGGDYVQAIMGCTVTMGFLMLVFGYYMGRKLSSLSLYNNQLNIKKYHAIFPKNNNQVIVSSPNIIKSIFIKFDNFIGSACFASMITLLGMLWDVIPAFGVLSSSNLNSYFEKIFGITHEPNITTKLSNFAFLMSTVSLIGILLSIRGCCISCKEYKNKSKYIEKENNNDSEIIIEMIKYNTRKELRKDFLSNQRYAVISSGISICFCLMMTGILLAKGLVNKNIMVTGNISLSAFLSIVRGVVFMLFGLTIITRNIIICNRENNLDQRFNEIYNADATVDSITQLYDSSMIH